jgi:hypothetical protein
MNVTPGNFQRPRSCQCSLALPVDNDDKLFFNIFDAPGLSIGGIRLGINYSVLNEAKQDE